MDSLVGWFWGGRGVIYWNRASMAAWDKLSIHHHGYSSTRVVGQYNDLLLGG